MPFAGIGQLAIVGTGLLGGSLGLAVRAAGFRGRILGIARRQETLDEALDRGCIDRGTLQLAEGVPGSDLVVLSVPVRRIPGLIQELAACGLGSTALVTDVGSTKAEIVQAAEKHLPSPGRFLGAHPMAGDTASGPSAARADLFRNRPCVLTPVPGTNPAVLKRLKTFWEALGMRVLEMSPDRHDRLTASISHLPHLLAVALVETVEHLGGWEIASTGFRDTSRLASSDPQMRLEIIQANRGRILEALAAFGEHLSELRSRIEQGDDEQVLKLLASIQEQRNHWAGTQGRDDPAAPGDL